MDRTSSWWAHFFSKLHTYRRIIFSLLNFSGILMKNFLESNTEVVIIFKPTLKALTKVSSLNGTMISTFADWWRKKRSYTIDKWSHFVYTIEKCVLFLSLYFIEVMRADFERRKRLADTFYSLFSPSLFLCLSCYWAFRLPFFPSIVVVYSFLRIGSNNCWWHSFSLQLRSFSALVATI